MHYQAQLYAIFCTVLRHSPSTQKSLNRVAPFKNLFKEIPHLTCLKDGCHLLRKQGCSASNEASRMGRLNALDDLKIQRSKTLHAPHT